MTEPVSPTAPRSTSPLPERLPVILAGGFVALSLILRVATAFTKSYSQDDFFWSYTAWLRSTNLVPRRDYYLANFTPLAEVFAPLFRMFPQSFIPINIARAVNLVLCLVLLWACYRVARLLGANVLWALIVVNIITWEFQFLKRICDVRSDQIGALALMVAAIVILDPNVRRTALWAGFWCGMAVAITYKLLIAAPFLGIGVLWLSRRPIRDGFLFGASISIAPILYFGWRLYADGLATFLAVWGDIFGAVGSGVSQRWPEIEGVIATGPLCIIAIIAGIFGLAKKLDDPLLTKRRRVYVIFAVAFPIVYCWANPFLFPYNMVILIPVIGPLAAGLPDIATVRLTRWAEFLLPLAAFVAGTFGVSDIINRTKFHQEHTIRWIWQMTSPNDAIFDWQGCVPWRPSTYHWWMYAGLMPKYYHLGWFSIDNEVRRAQVKVMIPNYRFMVIRPQDDAFLREHFVSVDVCLMLPGWVISSARLQGGATIDAYLLDETYLVQPAAAGVLLDGRQIQPWQRIRAGLHRVTVAPGAAIPQSIAITRITPAMLKSASPCEGSAMIYPFN